MLNDDEDTELYCICDEFCKEFEVEVTGATKQ